MNKDHAKNELGKQDEPVANVENIDIQPLADEDLESVVGGLCSLWSCSNKQTAETA